MADLVQAQREITYVEEVQALYLQRAEAALLARLLVKRMNWYKYGSHGPLTRDELSGLAKHLESIAGPDALRAADAALERSLV